MKKKRRDLIKNILGQETKKKLKKPIGQLYSVKSVFADPTLGVPEVNESLVNVKRKDRNKTLNSFENQSSWIPYLESALSPEFAVDFIETDTTWFDNAFLMFPNHEIFNYNDDIIFQLFQTDWGREGALPEEITIELTIDGNHNNDTTITLRNGWIEKAKWWMINQMEERDQPEELNESLVNVKRKDRYSSFQYYRDWIPHLESFFSPEFEVQYDDNGVQKYGLDSVTIDLVYKDNLYFQIRNIDVREGEPEEIMVIFYDDGSDLNDTIIELTDNWGWLFDLKEWIVKQLNPEETDQELNEDGYSDELGSNTLPQVPKWDNGITRGHANPIDFTKKWESGLTRGKANSLYESEIDYEKLQNVTRKNTHLSDDYINYEVSHGTLNPEHLSEIFLDFLKRFTWGREITEYISELDAKYKEEPRDEYLLDELFDLMNKVSPSEDIGFGASEGDGSSFGFWKYEDEQDFIG